VRVLVGTRKAPLQMADLCNLTPRKQEGLEIFVF